MRFMTFSSLMMVDGQAEVTISDVSKSRPWSMGYRFPDQFFVARSISFRKKRPVKENHPDPQRG